MHNILNKVSYTNYLNLSYTNHLTLCYTNYLIKIILYKLSSINYHI